MVETTWFYAPPAAIQDDWVTLPEEEAHHVSNVLRGGEGAEIVIVDGKGGWYRGRLEEMREEHAVARILERRREVGEPSYQLTIGIGMIKRRSRWETFLEKAVELGVSKIIPLATDHTEKERVREDRAHRVMRAALKQSRRSRLPTLEEITPLDELVSPGSRDDLHLVCHGRDDARGLATYFLSPTAARVWALVGPEGGFSPREIERLEEEGWKLAELGERRLRTETAGIVVAAVVQALLT